jgi:hypothetical protein
MHAVVGWLWLYGVEYLTGPYVLYVPYVAHYAHSTRTYLYYRSLAASRLARDECLVCPSIHPSSLSGLCNARMCAPIFNMIPCASVPLY